MEFLTTILFSENATYHLLLFTTVYQFSLNLFLSNELRHYPPFNSQLLKLFKIRYYSRSSFYKILSLLNYLVTFRIIKYLEFSSSFFAFLKSLFFLHLVRLLSCFRLNHSFLPRGCLLSFSLCAFKLIYRFSQQPLFLSTVPLYSP